MTYNRGKLLKLAKDGRLTAIESYRFDDMYGESQTQNDTHQDWKEGVFDLDEWNFKSKSGSASLNEDGTIMLYVHSNLNYTFKILEA